MELEHHRERASIVFDAMNTASEQSAQATIAHSGDVLGIFHPDVLKSRWELTKALGMGVRELISIVPHAPELYREWRVRRTNE